MFNVNQIIKEIKSFISDKFENTKGITKENINELRDKVSKLDKMVKKKIKR